MRKLSWRVKKELIDTLIGQNRIDIRWSWCNEGFYTSLAGVERVDGTFAYGVGGSGSTVIQVVHSLFNNMTTMKPEEALRITTYNGNTPIYRHVQWNEKINFWVPCERPPHVANRSRWDYVA